MTPLVCALCESAEANGVGHSFFLFGQLLVTILSLLWTVFGHFLPIPFAYPFCARVRMRLFTYNQGLSADGSSFLLVVKGENEHKLLVSSNFSCTPGISRPKSRDIPPKRLVSWALMDIPNFWAPTPSCGRPPPGPTRRYPDPKVWVYGLFFPA